MLRQYLDAYFNTVVPDPRTDQLNITLVDGFCGGGAYQEGRATEYGSPIILLNAIETAEKRLNQVRGKPLRINARFIFVDSNANHIASLREQIRQLGFGSLLANEIELLHGTFEEHLPHILSSIRLRQRAGRSIFILDQCGYKDVPMHTMRAIFAGLERPEVILTFAIDALLNYLQESYDQDPLYAQFGVDRAFVQAWKANKDDKASGRMFAQRMLMRNIHQNSGAPFFTPFMLWSPTDNRMMMLAHLSKHQMARNKMLEVHWDTQNYFWYFGKGSLFLLGFDERLLDSKDALFSFAEHDHTTLMDELRHELPQKVRDRTQDSGLPVETLLAGIGNRTAATNEDILTIIRELVHHREFEVISKNGKIKRVGTQIEVSDRLLQPAQPLLFLPSPWRH